MNRDPDESGTEVSFLPDATIFEETVYDFDILKVRLRETAFLTKALKIVLIDDRVEKKEMSSTMRVVSRNLLPISIRVRHLYTMR